MLAFFKLLKCAVGIKKGFVILLLSGALVAIGFPLYASAFNPMIKLLTTLAGFGLVVFAKSVHDKWTDEQVLNEFGLIMADLDSENPT